MTDRELLELAARAIGKKLRWWPVVGGDDMPVDESYEEFYIVWNPLASKGCALDLAVNLKMGVSQHDGYCAAQFFYDVAWNVFKEEHKGDPVKATCRAIVRAAAEIGRNMK